jgi:hypothetical protein
MTRREVIAALAAVIPGEGPLVARAPTGIKRVGVI